MSQEDNEVEEHFEVVDMEEKLDFLSGGGCGFKCS